MFETYRWHLPKFNLKKFRADYHKLYCSINIITINQTDYLFKCLQSIYNTTDHNFPKSEINIWENGSEPSAQVALREKLSELENKHPSFKLNFILHNNNDGFAKAHNRLVTLSKGEYIIIANDDMEFFEENWINKMINALTADVIQVGGINDLSCNRLGGNGHGYVTDKRMTEYIDGALFAMTRDWALALGPFDDRVYKFAYCEDPDLSFRIASMGFRFDVVEVNHAHYRSATTSKQTNFDLEGYGSINRLRLTSRWNYYFTRRAFNPRIAVVRAGAIGDVIMVTSVISKIRELAPYATIDVYTRCGLVFENNEKVDNIYEYEQINDNKMKYHSIIGLDDSYEREPRMLTYKAYYKSAGLEGCIMNWTEMYLSDEEKEIAEKIITDHKKKCVGDRIAIFHTGKTAWSGRNLELEKFIEVAKYMQDKGYSIIEVGGKETESMGILSTQLFGKPFRETAAVIARGDIFVGIDSGPWNVAQAFMVPSVVAFGCINPDYRIFEKKFTRSVTAQGMSCLGCHHEHRGPIHESRCVRENKPIALCMQGITAAQIIKEIEYYDNGGREMSETSKIRETVAEYINKGDYGIDIGCGPDKLYNTSVGFDKRPSAVTDVIGNAYKLDFSDNEFDYVYSSHCLEDMLGTREVLVEWLRVIKPGGKIALYLPHRDYYKGVNLDHVREFVEKDITDILVDLGCNIDLSYLDIGDFNGVKDNRYSFLVVATKGA